MHVDAIIKQRKNTNVMIIISKLLLFSKMCLGEKTMRVVFFYYHCNADFFEWFSFRRILMEILKFLNE